MKTYDFTLYNDVAKQYGYEINSEGVISLNGKPTMVKLDLKGSRLRINGSNGNLLASYPAKPESVEKFVKAFWFAEKKIIA